jgi:hypothetical protein
MISPGRRVRVAVGLSAVIEVAGPGSAPLALLALSSCAPVPESSRQPEMFPDYLPRRAFDHYGRIRTVVLDDGERRWAVTPNAVLEFSNGFLDFEYGAGEGLDGNILSVDQDESRLWIGTTRALQSLDKDLHLVRTYLEDPALEALFVGARRNDQSIAVTSRGVVLTDALSLSLEIYPLESFDAREVNSVVLFEGNLWAATQHGLRRFSVSFKSWNQNFGPKQLKEENVLRLEVAEDRIGDTVVGHSLYAITGTEVYIYRSGFDSWERLGL